MRRLRSWVGATAKVAAVKGAGWTAFLGGLFALTFVFPWPLVAVAGVGAWAVKRSRKPSGKGDWPAFLESHPDSVGKRRKR